ncbi:unnamed protein product [marine sediment metagenome]|uniref:Asparagine synthetase domain-containing protein n=1 Tax=marine sediment metagenome TaxID=412755 RepID=X1I785_9ZZZZ
MSMINTASLFSGFSKKKEPLKIEPEIIAKHLKHLIKSAIERKTDQAAELGCWLSGGLDSSAIASLISANGHKLYTFAAKLNPKPIWPKHYYSKDTSDRGQFKTRHVFFEGKELECQIYERSHLPAGIKIMGPAIIQEKESTVLVGLRWSFKVDEMGNINLRSSM